MEEYEKEAIKDANQLVYSLELEELRAIAQYYYIRRRLNNNTSLELEDHLCGLLALSNKKKV